MFTSPYSRRIAVSFHLEVPRDDHRFPDLGNLVEMKLTVLNRDALFSRNISLIISNIFVVPLKPGEVAHGPVYYSALSWTNINDLSVSLRRIDLDRDHATFSASNKRFVGDHLSAKSPIHLP